MGLGCDCGFSHGCTNSIADRPRVHSQVTASSVPQVSHCGLALLRASLRGAKGVDMQAAWLCFPGRSCAPWDQLCILSWAAGGRRGVQSRRGAGNVLEEKNKGWTYFTLIVSWNAGDKVQMTQERGCGGREAVQHRPSGGRAQHPKACAHGLLPLFPHTGYSQGSASLDVMRNVPER